MSEHNDEFAALRKALEAGPTPGPRKAICRDVGYIDGEWSRDEFLQWEIVGLDEPSGRGRFYQGDAMFIAACDPATIARLLAARDRAKELEADARRYRWLRQQLWNLRGDELRFYTLETLRLERADSEPLDAAIDRAQGTAT